jgi:hypothetical protein
MKKAEEKTKERTIEELRKAKDFIVMTGDCAIIYGNQPDILTLFAILVSRLSEKIDKGTLEDVFNIGLKSRANKKNQTKDLEKTLNKLNKILKKIVED